MVRILIASLAFTASIAAACPSCGTHATDATDPAVQKVSAPAENTKSCDGVCPLTGGKLTLVSAETAEECTASCEKACDTPCDSGKANSISYVSYMPKMAYRVGDETTTCVKTAGAMASETNTEMHFVVNGAEFASQEQAMMAHGKQLEGMMMNLVRVQYAVSGECVSCPTEAKALAASCETKTLQYQVGPATFDNAEDAINASIMAYNAAQKVNVEYVVGDETTTCSKTAGAMASAANCSVEYVVNGQRTHCDKAAAYMKTLASVQSALKALETAAAGA